MNTQFVREGVTIIILYITKQMILTNVFMLESIKTIFFVKSEVIIFLTNCNFSVSNVRCLCIENVYFRESMKVKVNIVLLFTLTTVQVS